MPLHFFQRQQHGPGRQVMPELRSHTGRRDRTERVPKLRWPVSHRHHHAAPGSLSDASEVRSWGASGQRGTLFLGRRLWHAPQPRRAMLSALKKDKKEKKERTESESKEESA